MDFGIKLEKGSTIFRSVKDRAHITGGQWYAFQPYDTYGYGNITYSFRVKEDLQLIDFTNMNFYNDIMAKINKIPDTELVGNLQLKYALMFAIGFPDINTYIEFARDIIHLPIKSSIPFVVKLDCQLYNNRLRHSLDLYDDRLKNYLKDNYGNSYNGVIMSTRLPDLIAGGHQHPEMILFDPTLVEPIQEIQRATPGGGNIQDKPKKGKIPLSIALGLAKSSHDSVLSSKNFSESDKEYQRSYRPFDKIEEEYNITIPRIEGTRIPVDLDKFIESIEEKDGIIDLNYPTPRIVHKKSSDIKIPFSLGVAYDSNNKPYITGVDKYNPDEQQNISTIAQINSTKLARKHRKTRRRTSR